MPQRAGSADLPLHDGRVPRWLGERMAKLAAVICAAIMREYGRDELLRRLAHPFWFQSFGAVMGMDWHSSGITTSVIGALKRGLNQISGEFGLHVCGGRGRHSRRTPEELTAIGDRVGFDGIALARASRLVAKVDSAALQDGFDLYLHSFIVAEDAKWVVVQQGMNGARGTARRYHWLSEGLRSFVDQPHAAIEGGPSQADGKKSGCRQIINLTDHRAETSRRRQIDVLGTLGPDGIVRHAAALGPDFTIKDGVSTRLRAKMAATNLADGAADTSAMATAPAGGQALLPFLVMPAHHDVRAEDVVARRLRGSLAAAAERGPADFSELLLVPGVGSRTVLALAMVAEVIHGAPCRFSDPARFSMAHGGKDRHPFPVPLKVYDHTISVLKSAVQKAALGQGEELAALRRLDDQARRLERSAALPDIDTFMEEERHRSPEYGGRSVFGMARPTAPKAAWQPLSSCHATAGA